MRTATAPGWRCLTSRAPSREVQEERLRRRGDKPELIARRLAKADQEEAAGKALADHIVVNDDLGQAVDQVVGIVEAHRRSRRGGAPLQP